MGTVNEERFAAFATYGRWRFPYYASGLRIGGAYVTSYVGSLISHGRWK